MFRNLKILALAGMAMAALGAFGASGAKAAEFHCSAEPCRYTLKPDGTGKTAHHVFRVKNSIGESFVFTCDQLTGEATTATKSVTTLTFTGGFGFGCTGLGSAAASRMNGCDFLYGATGTLSIKGCGGIEFEAGGCVLKIFEQGPLGGVAFHNIGEEGSTTTEMTAEVSGLSLAISLSGGVKCGIDTTKTPITGEYQTGNVIITGETDPSGVMANAWWT